MTHILVCHHLFKIHNDHRPISVSNYSLNLTWNFRHFFSFVVETTFQFSTFQAQTLFLFFVIVFRCKRWIHIISNQSIHISRTVLETSSFHFISKTHELTSEEYLVFSSNNRCWATLILKSGIWNWSLEICFCVHFDAEWFIVRHWVRPVFCSEMSCLISWCLNFLFQHFIECEIRSIS